eukprot:TRINITY_DN13261_c0_g1_i1.p1 TRINITY_DN13261_c0_g1~~TRINITY_DN13261_c0_g1_i1.p1  ORF type:complete len:323 (+),score=40.53 TRINITY_DN13261_c0_g1_i1:48-1016(+)
MVGRTFGDFRRSATEPLLRRLSFAKDADPATRRRNKVRCVSAALVIGGLLVGGLVFHAEVVRSLNMLIEYCKSLGWVAALVVAAVVTLLNVLMMPTFPLFIASGVLFPKMFGLVTGQVVATLVCFGGLWLGGIASFLLGRYFFKDWAEAELSHFEWMRVMNGMVEKNGWWVVLLARMSPLVPAEMFSYACSITSLSLLSYCIGGLGAVVPVVMWVSSAAAAAAASEDEAEGADDPVLQRHRRQRRLCMIIFNVVFIVVLSLVLYIAMRRYRNQQDHEIDALIERRVTSGHLSPARREEEKTRVTQEVRRPRFATTSSRTLAF